MRKVVFRLFLVFSVVTSCVKDDIKNHEKELLSFILESANNPDYLQEDIVGEVDGSTIRLILPQKIDLTSLVPSFDFVGENVYLNDQEQLSGISEIDLSEDLYYQIKAENGTVVTYRVVIELLQFTSFKFKMEENVGLVKDYDLSFSADTLQIRMKGTNKNLVASFETNATEVLVNNTIQRSSVTENDFSQPVTYSLIYGNGLREDFVIVVEWQRAIPQFYIDTEGAMPIVSTDDYVAATLSIDGVEDYEDFEGATEIRGRGNSTWGRPKKPYRIKLNKKASILGLKEAKNWVLLANHFDETLMLNAVAMKIGSLLEIDYANHMIPVEVVLNGEFLGNYMLTEQIEVNENRINIEAGGHLLEMDSYFKNDWQFKSAAYALPVEVKYPKLKNYDQTDAESELAQMKAEFEEFESRVFDSDFPNSSYLDLFDQQAFVDYLIVYMLTGNIEINHPKSTFIYKPKGGKYTMGPIWDFDWAFSFNGVNKHFIRTDEPLFWNNSNSVGTVFFKRLLTDPSTKQLLMARWSDFKATQLEELMVYIDEYADLIKGSQIRDREKWNVGSVNFEGDVTELKNWVINRSNFLDGYIAGL